MKKTSKLMFVLASVFAASGVCQAQTTDLISKPSFSPRANGNSQYPAISANGRFVVFQSDARNLVPSDHNSNADIFLYDYRTGLIEMISLNQSGLPGNSYSFEAEVSGDGRYVVFESDATDLVPNDTNGAIDIFVRDRQAGTTQRASVSTLGVEADRDCYSPTISGDGRFVAFQTKSGNLVAGDTDQNSDVFTHDLQSGVTEMVSLNYFGGQVSGECYNPSLSASGQFIAFDTFEALVLGDV